MNCNASMPGLPKSSTPAVPHNSSDEIDLENVPAAGTVEFRKTGARIFLVDRPARMLAGIHAIKLAVQHTDIVHVARARHEIDEQHRLARLDVVLDQARRVAFIARHFGILGAIRSEERRVGKEY